MGKTEIWEIIPPTIGYRVTETLMIS